MLSHILDKYDDATAIHAINAIPDGLNADRIARIARVQVASPIKPVILASGEPVSNWWLITFAGLEPVQVAIWPPSSKAEAMALNPTALSATPMQAPLTQTVAIETPQALLDLMRSGGYSLSVNGDDLHIDQAHWVDEELVGLITIHKTGLIKILESEVMQICE